MSLATSHPVTQTSNHGIMTWNKRRANITSYNKISSALRLFFYHRFTLVRPMLGNPKQSWIPLGFLVSGNWILDSLSWITDSKAEGSGFHKQNFSRIPESGWPYRALLCISGISSLRKSRNMTDSLYFHKKLTWRNYRLIFYNAVTYRLQLVGIFWYIRLMLFDDEKVLGFFEIQFVGSPRSPPLTSSLRSVLSLKSLPQSF